MACYATRRDFCRSILFQAAALFLPPFIPAAMARTYDRSYYHKIRNPDKTAPGDLWATKQELRLLNACRIKLIKVMRTVGFGRFNFIDFRSVFETAASRKKIYRDNGKIEHNIPFSDAEQNYMHMLFNFDAEKYGFYGKKVINTFDHAVRRTDLTRIAKSGHYLFKGAPVKLYNEIVERCVRYGEHQKRPLNIVLTSGVRNVPKQMYLFLSKAHRVRGNLSAASRSLAPPGYSWHGTSDFDVGKPKAGMTNFSPRFTNTRQFRVLKKMGYLKLLRYPQDNLRGVRFEPWHIMVGRNSAAPESYHGIEDLMTGNNPRSKRG